MKKIFLSLSLLVCTLYIQAQTFDVTDCKYRQLDTIISNYKILDYHGPASYLDHLELTIDTFHLSLDRVEINPEVVTSSGYVLHDNFTHYRNSDLTAAFSFSDQQEVMGVILTERGSYNVGKLKDFSQAHIIFCDSDLSRKNDYQCAELRIPDGIAERKLFVLPSSATVSKCINIYLETDFDLYNNKGSSSNVNFYMQGIFNVKQMLFQRDSINISFRKLYIWDHQDPYTGPSTGDYLTQFNSYRPTYDGDIGHLVGLNGGGGIAWVNTLQFPKQYRTGYSGIGTSYNNLPLYSWTVDCITHEHGHILGSNHTHDCVWNGNNTRIDDCGTHAGYGTAGACGQDIPDSPGTIMSYCQLRLVGKNLMLGFGPQPRDTMRSSISRASTISTICNCLMPVIPNKITGLSPVFKISTGIYSTNFVAGCTYTWFLPPSAIGLSTTNTITLNFTDIYAGGEVCVLATNACGISDSSCITVDVDLTNEPLSIEEILNNHKKGKIHIYDMLGQEILKPDDLWIHGIYILRAENYFRKIFK